MKLEQKINDCVIFSFQFARSRMNEGNSFGIRDLNTLQQKILGKIEEIFNEVESESGVKGTCFKCKKKARNKYSFVCGACAELLGMEKECS